MITKNHIKSHKSKIITSKADWNSNFLKEIIRKKNFFLAIDQTLTSSFN